MLRTIINLSKINVLSDIKIFEKALLFLFPIIILGFNQKLITPSIINILFSLIMMKALKIPLKIYYRFIRGIFIFLTIGMIPIALDNQLDKVIVIIFRSISSISLIFLFSTTTPLEYIFYELNKKEFLVEFSEIARTMLRLLIIVEDEFKRINYAMNSRLGLIKFKNKLRNYAKILGILFLNCLNKFEQIEESLKSRGYNGKIYFSYSERKRSKKIIVLGIVYNLFLYMVI